MSNRTDHRYRPFRTILKKEWKQSAILRRAALVLMVLLTPFVILVADAATRGWIPMFRVSSYTFTDLMMEAVPALIGLLWGFFALLACANAFATDRSTGNENFLLERPISRSTVWKARLAATLLNSLAVMALGWVVWFLFSSALADPAEGVFGHSSNLLLGLGSILVLVVICGGVAAAALVDAPMLAFLGGGLLAAAPFGLASYLGGVSPSAVALQLDPDLFPTLLITMSRLPVGAVLPLLLFPAYVFASYRVLCKGEPAGRGKRKRGAQVLFGTLAGVFVLFLLLAPLAVRASVNRGLRNNFLVPSPSRGRAVLDSGGWYSGGGYLIDTRNAKKIKLLPGSIVDQVWEKEGRFLAVIGEMGIFSWAGFRGWSLDILDGKKGSRIAEFELPSDCEFHGAVWVGGKILVGLTDSEKWSRLKGTDQADGALLFYLAEEGKKGWKDGTIRKLNTHLRLDGNLEEKWWIFSTGRSQDQAIFSGTVLKKGERPRKKPGRSNFGNLEVLRLQIDGDSLEGSLLGRMSGNPFRTRFSLSPSGRYAWWIEEDSVRKQRHLGLIDFGANESVPVENTEGARWAYWLENDEFLWTRKVDDHVNLYRWKPGEEEILLMETDPGRFLALDPSPDRRKVILSSYRHAGVPEGTISKRSKKWIYDSATGEFRPVKLDGWITSNGAFFTRWADPETVLWSDEEKVYLESIQEPGNPVELR